MYVFFNPFLSESMKNFHFGVIIFMKCFWRNGKGGKNKAHSIAPGRDDSDNIVMKFDFMVVIFKYKVVYIVKIDFFE